MGEYGTALICLNGHVISDNIDRVPSASVRCCQRCGKGVIQKCVHCAEPIRGSHKEDLKWAVDPSVPLMRDPPLFCHACGEPFPWTEQAQQAALQAIANSEHFSDEERKLLLERITVVNGGESGAPVSEPIAGPLKVKLQALLMPIIQTALGTVAAQLLNRQFGL